jgi:hypothetical protein
MDDPTQSARHAEIAHSVEEWGLPYPLVAINGALEVAGTAEFYHIVPLVEKALAQQELVSQKVTALPS